MMGHHRPEYRGWIEAAGYAKAKDLYTYELDIRIDMVPLIDRLIAAGERNPRIRIRNVDKSQVRRAKRRSSSTCSTTPGRTIGASCR